jgi:hypothetical protein
VTFLWPHTFGWGLPKTSVAVGSSGGDADDGDDADDDADDDAADDAAVDLGYEDGDK